MRDDLPFVDSVQPSPSQVDDPWADVSLPSMAYAVAEGVGLMHKEMGEWVWL